MQTTGHVQCRGADAGMNAGFLELLFYAEKLEEFLYGNLVDHHIHPSLCQTTGA